MTVDTSEPGDARPTVVVASGEWDVADEGLQQSLLAAVRGGDGRVIIDMMNVTFIDSSVVRAILLAHREAAERDGWVRIVYTHHLIRRVFDICGLGELFPQFTSVDAAIRGVYSHRHPEGPMTGEGAG